MRAKAFRVLPLLASAGAALWSQGTQTATLSATILDKAGAPIAGAIVILNSPALLGERRIQADRSGKAVAPLLPPGTYRIVVTADGFQTVVLLEHIGLEQIFSPRVHLAPNASAVVSVEAAAIEADRAEFRTAYNYDKATMDALPIVFRDTLSILELTPGVVRSWNAGLGQFEVRGAAGSGNLILVDGQNTMDNYFLGQRIGVVFDAIDEMQVMVGALPAEYGQVEGGVVNSVTKQGGDTFSGCLRWDLHNPAWNAAQPMADRVSASPNLLAIDRSLTLGGFIIPSRLWFFFGYFDSHPQTPMTYGFAPWVEDAAFSYGGSFLNPATPIPTSDYLQQSSDFRRTAKLTWAVDASSTLSASYSDSSLAYNRNYASGEPASIVPFSQTGYFWNVAWRSVPAPWMSLSLKVGAKSQTFLKGPNPLAYGYQVLSTQDFLGGAIFASPNWDWQDPQPDKRENRTANLKLSLFWEAHGNHGTDLGVDWYRGVTRASGFGGSGHVSWPGLPPGWISTMPWSSITSLTTCHP